jgi:hypothetical protein
MRYVVLRQGFTLGQIGNNRRQSVPICDLICRSRC